MNGQKWENKKQQRRKYTYILVWFNWTIIIEDEKKQKKSNKFKWFICVRPVEAEKKFWMDNDFSTTVIILNVEVANVYNTLNSNKKNTTKLNSKCAANTKWNISLLKLFHNKKNCLTFSTQKGEIAWALMHEMKYRSKWYVINFMTIFSIKFIKRL